MKKKTWFRWGLPLVLVCLLLVFIWNNSAAEGTESVRHSGAVLAFLSPMLQWLKIPGQIQGALIRKTAHVVEFALLGAVLLWLMRAWGGNHRLLQKPLPKALGVCTLAALADEGIQYFVPGRRARLSDVGLDILGALLGMVLVLVIGWGKARKKNRTFSDKGKAP